MSLLKLTLFGPPCLERDDQPVTIGRRKGLALLSYLAVTGQAHSRDSLGTLLWPDLPARRVRANLRQTLSDLNKVLGPGRLTTVDAGVGLAESAELWVDVVRFRACLVACREHGHPTTAVCPVCLPLLTEAAELYQADFLAGFNLRGTTAFEEWQYFTGEALRQTLSGALERLIWGHSEQGAYEAALPYARRWPELDPLHEPAQQALMQLYQRAGQASAALRQYELYADRLEEELGLPPNEETTTLYEAIKANRLLEPNRYITPPAVETPSGGRAKIDEDLFPSSTNRPRPLARHHLPVQSTPFVGREAELAEIGHHLQDSACRLLTLVGPGGMGKTRLALAAAEAIQDDFLHGVHFIPLAPLQAPDQIISALAEGLDIRFYGQTEPKQQLLDYLAARHLLLVIDNFEHLLAGGDLVAELLRASPQLKILATSRERLNLGGETVLTVGGMRYPELDDEAALAEYSAVKLLLQQARLVRPGFAPERADLTTTSRICRLVQGMPLALVLAAGWLEMLSLADIETEIVRSLDFLETEQRDMPQRQRSLRAVFDSSWARLQPEAQTAFMKLSIFRGGFNRTAAVAVAGAGLRSLRALVNKSFVVFTQAERYEIHELLRQYGQERLAASDLEGEVRRGHGLYFLEFLRYHEIDLRGRDQIAGLSRIKADLENVRLAWNWGLEQKETAAIDAAVECLHLFFDMSSLYQEGIAWLNRGHQALAPQGDERPSLAWGKIMARRCFMQIMTGIIDEAEFEAEAQSCLTLAEQYQDQAEIGLCCSMLSVYMFMIKQESATALSLLERAQGHFQAVDDQFYMARVLAWLSWCHYYLSGNESFESFLRQSLAVSRQIGNLVDTTVALANLAEIALVAGRYEEAQNHCQEVISLANQMDLRGVKIFAENLLSLGRLLQGELTKTQQGLRQAWALHLETNIVLDFVWLTALFSVWTVLGGDDRASQDYGRQSLAEPIGGPLATALAHWGLALSDCNQNHFTAARQHLTEAFDQAEHNNSAAMQTWLLPAAAVVWAGEGNPAGALEMLALAATHPLSPQGWQARWARLAELRAELEATLGPDRYQAIWERGRGLALAAVVEAWLGVEE